MAIPDVEIRGAGIFGLAVACACAKRGASVRVVEKRRIAAGASGGPVGSLSPHAPDNWNLKKQFQFESLAMAKEWWNALEAMSGVNPGFLRKGRVQPVATERGLALSRQRAEHAKRRWKQYADWRVVRVEELDGWRLCAPIGWAVHDTLSARINPTEALRCLAEALRSLGGEIIQGENPTPEAGAVVWATGYEGLMELSKELGLELGSGEKGQALSLEFEASDRPQVYADGVHVVPHADGTTAIGSTSERQFESADDTDERLDELHANAIRMLPELEGAAVLKRWAGIRPRSRSRAPLLGKHPRKGGNFVANGGFKTGFGMAPLVGEVIADLVLDGIDRIPKPLALSEAMRAA